MGRIKTSFIKHIGIELFEKHAENFSIDFEKNKEAVNKLATFKSKHMRNIVAGYLTSLKRSQTKQ
jgi:small subunit ribosomal protein S17e